VNEKMSFLLTNSQKNLNKLFLQNLNKLFLHENISIVNRRITKYHFFNTADARRVSGQGNV